MSPNSYTVLILPGWQDSGPAHWQTHWETIYGYQRVQQHDWMHPLRGDWMTQLEEAVLAAPHPVVLVAHSLGCILTAAWAAHSHNTHRIHGALLVAPPDTEREALRPVLKSWAPVVLQRLPFNSLMLNCQEDPYIDRDRAELFAKAWGSAFVDYGNKGHINADSGLGDWPEGHTLLTQLCNTTPAAAEHA